MIFQSVTFMNSNASRDVSYDSGGAFYVQDSTINMNNCSFMNNIARSGGGLIAFDSNLTMKQSQNQAIISNNDIKHNKADQGGFVYAIRSSIEFQNDNFIYNHAKFGGALFIIKSILTIIGNNNASTVQQTVARQNYATSEGGIIYATDNSKVEMNHYSFSNNTCGCGGTIFFAQDSSLSLKVARDDATTFEIEGNNIDMI